MNLRTFLWSVRKVAPMDLDQCDAIILCRAASDANRANRP